MARHPVIGVEFEVGNHPDQARNQAGANGFQFIALPIAHPRYKKFSPIQQNNFTSFTRSDMAFSFNQWNGAVIGSIDVEIDPDCGSESEEKNNEDIFLQLFKYGTHLAFSAILIRLDGRLRPNLARILSDMMANENAPYITPAWMVVPITDPRSISNEYRSDVQNEESDPWEWWTRFKLMCNSDIRVSLALELTADLPSEDVITRWFGEPIKLIVIPISIFLTNKKGYPVLSLAHQSFMKKCAFFGIQILLTGLHGELFNSSYNNYLNHIYAQITYYENILPNMKGYCDHLQIPLQPLMDNLESNTYEIFEKDPVKYNEYQNAIAAALLDRVSEEEAETNVQVIMVVGAGRGPLVDAALIAAGQVKRKVKCYAIEKNPNALITLFEKRSAKWNNEVEVVGTDMRVWNAPEKCDILVSELLGSFGDNELSPECLDGAQKFLKPDGISIPCEYTSYICPLQSSKLYNKARYISTGDKPNYVKFETPYVVHQVNVFRIAPPQPVFKFVHPNHDPVIDNRRYKKLTFDVKQNCVLYGFSGYFETVLYKDKKLSILPDQASPGMFSWFPIYFPIRDPIYLKKGDMLDFHIWRLVSKTSVWYEWSITNPLIIPIHNQNGRSSRIGLL